MSAIYWVLIAYVFTLGVVGLLWVAAVEIGKWRDRRWAAERPARPVADPEWVAGLFDHPPIFAEVATEHDMGQIFEAGYERQAKRLREELEDRAAFDRWLHGGSR
jgi:hypothetical protein